MKVVDDRKDDIAGRVNLGASLNAEIRRTRRDEGHRCNNEENYYADSYENWHGNLPSNDKDLALFTTFLSSRS